MDESSKAPMETDVSSTTDDVPETPEVSASQPSVETVVVVETIKEEVEASPGKEKNLSTPNKPAEAKSPTEATRAMDRPPLKKIIIKSPNNKDYQIVKIISAISDESKKPASSSQTSQPSNSNIVDSSSKPESQNCLSKSTDVTQTNKTSEKEASMPKIIIRSPIKVQAQDPKTLSETSEKSPRKDTQVKENLNDNVSLSKEMSNKATPTKDTSSKVSPVKESTSKDSFIKESFPKVVLTKEIIPMPVQSKETDDKSSSKSSTDEITINNEQTAKTNENSQPHSQNSKTESLDNKPLSSGASAPSKSNASSIDIDKEASNDSQMETNSDTSEKEHNKSISRELRSLINSAKESKIISECTQLTSKTRKSRAPLDSANSSLNTSVDAEKIQGGRRNSDNSQESGCSEKSEKGLKRSMRSQNPEFVTKVKHFLNSVSAKNQKESEESGDEEQDGPKAKENETKAEPSEPKKKKTDDQDKPSKLRTDPYCWRCHWAVDPAAGEKGHPPVHCTVCPRSFHFKCLSVSERTKVSSEKSWVCPECSMILSAEGSETRSLAMKKISLGMLCELLKHALDRMMEINGVEPFMHPVDRTVFPDYDKYVVHPMDLTQMRNNITSGQYGSTEAFLADAQWILHNSIIFNTLQSKLTGGARALVRSCRAEMGEIEACPECYAAAHARRPTWFTDVCTTPHVLLWSKLKGFPYWPAKGMSVNSSGLVDVRFFGAHDRAWVPARDCFLYSEKDPNNFRTKRQDILESMQEAEHHIRNISRKYGKFVYPPFRTQFDPSKLEEQLKMMIPSFEGEIKPPLKDKSHSSPSLGKDKSKSHARNSKAAMDGEADENEEVSATKTRKMADGKEIAGDEDFAVEKEKEMEVDSSQNKETGISTPRKRRQSALEEAVITIIDNSSSRAKKRRAESVEITSETKGSEPVATPKTSKSVDEKRESDKAKPDEKNKTDPKTKDNEPSSSTASPADKKRTPIRLISIAKVLKTAKVNAAVAEKTPPSKAENKTEKPEKTSQKPKSNTDKSDLTEKVTMPNKAKDQKRRNSRNKSTNNASTPKPDKKAEKIADSSVNKEKTGQNKDANKSITEKVGDKSVTGSPRSKDRLQFDDDISLATIARESKTPTTHTNVSALPTICNVRSLSATAQNTTTTTTKTTSKPKTVEVTVEASSNSSIFTPTSTDNVKTMKDAVNKLQKLRNEDPPPVGRVGVRAFARMTSPPKETPKDVEVEIKAEPIDFDDSDRQVEKMDLMNAFQLRPVVRPTPTTNLREVRINKVVVSTPSTATAPSAAKSSTNNSKARAKKTFPQPKKDDGRSELNSKNSMVYIPIQPPMSQAPGHAPARLPRPQGPATLRTGAPHIVTTATVSNVVSTVTSLVPVSLSALTKPGAPGASTSQAQVVPTVGQVPTTVHTVPLITSVNGQWTFSLQPVMSVGGVDGAPSPPMMNGLTERNSLLPLQAPPAPALVSTSASAPTLVPAAPAPPVLVPTSTSQTLNRSDSNPPREPPRLQQRPPLVNPLDAHAPLGSVPPPSTAGALTAKLNQHSVKMTDFFRTLLEDCIEKLEDPLAQAAALKLQLEQVQWKHQQLVDEIKHNHELTLAEMRSSFEKERQRVINETRRVAQTELEAAVKVAKAKQWCAHCSQEAQFYCCWNTSYCDYPCQRAHWTQHYAVCTQARQDGSSNDSGNPPEDRLQPAPENLPKTTAAPSLTVGSKLAPSRVYTQDNSPKTSIIMSMVEDPSGNQTLKCVGTYKSPAAPAQIAPLIINKQIMSNEESKKVVTSGGYLIVGAGAGAAPPPAPTLVNARRPHTIQYFT